MERGGGYGLEGFRCLDFGISMRVAVAGRCVAAGIAGRALGEMFDRCFGYHVGRLWFGLLRGFSLIDVR